LPNKAVEAQAEAYSLAPSPALQNTWVIDSPYNFKSPDPLDESVSASLYQTEEASPEENIQRDTPPVSVILLPATSHPSGISLTKEAASQDAALSGTVILLGAAYPLVSEATSGGTPGGTVSSESEPAPDTPPPPDITPPVIEITSPLDGAILVSTPVTVRYKADGVKKTKDVDLVEGANTITISETDLAGNTGSAYITVNLDTGVFVITNIQVTNITGTSATVTWTTNEPASSKVEYGATSGYGSSTTEDTNRVLNHSVNITGLASETLYHFRTVSKDAGANEAKSPDNTFTTIDTTPPTQPQVTIDSMSSTSIQASWSSTDPESGISKYEYSIGTTQGGIEVLDWQDAGLNTTMNRAGLNISYSITYYVNVRATNGAGLVSTTGSAGKNLEDIIPPVNITLDDPVSASPISTMLYGSNVVTPYNWDGAFVNGQVDPSVLVKVKDIKPTILRFPGGGVSDRYFWWYGIGPDRSAPPSQDVEDYTFGIYEFIEMCEAIECTDKMITVNYFRGTAQAAANWVEYCNGTVPAEPDPGWATSSYTGDQQAPAGYFAWLRSYYGHPEPYNIKYWEIGNEVYWEDINLKPEGYAEQMTKFVVAMREKDPTIKIIAGIASNNTKQWVDAITAQRVKIDYLAPHYYPNLPGGGAVFFAQNDEYVMPFHIDTTIDASIQITASAELMDDGVPAQMMVTIDDNDSHVYDILAEKQVVSIGITLEPGDHTIAVSFINDGCDPVTRDDRNLLLHEVIVKLGEGGFLSLLNNQYLGRAMYFYGDQTHTMPFHIDETVNAMMHITASATLMDDGIPAQMRVTIDDHDSGVYEIATEEQPLNINLRMPLEPGDHTIAVSFINDDYDREAGDDRNIILYEVSLKLGGDGREISLLYDDPAVRQWSASNTDEISGLLSDLKSWIELSPQKPDIFVTEGSCGGGTFFANDTNDIRVTRTMVTALWYASAVATFSKYDVYGFCQWNLLDSGHWGLIMNSLNTNDTKVYTPAYEIYKHMSGAMRGAYVPLEIAGSEISVPPTVPGTPAYSTQAIKCMAVEDMAKGDITVMAINWDTDDRLVFIHPKEISAVKSITAATVYAIGKNPETDKIAEAVLPNRIVGAQVEAVLPAASVSFITLHLTDEDSDLTPPA